MVVRGDEAQPPLSHPIKSSGAKAAPNRLLGSKFMKHL
jgi:hypothetical protein